MSEKIMIGKKEYLIEEKNLRQEDLLFYPENPRVYSALNISGLSPSQADIEEKMTSFDHVKQLKYSIEANGGLIDPLIVRDGDFVVLEGNSRLAAYRLLAKKDPIKWGYVRCQVLPADIPESSVFALLGQYHIIGRKDWSPFEQAGYLYRRIKTSEISADIIAKELGLEINSAKNYIRVYEFMVENNDLESAHWSYYDEYLKNRGIKKYRETYEKLNETIVTQIKTGQIAQAIDIRNKLGAIAKVSGRVANRVMQKISEGKLDIYSGFEEIEGTGKTNDAYQVLNNFRGRIDKDDFKQKVKRGDKGQITLELKKIRKLVDGLLNEMR